ncbi:unnamed protein product [Leptidea sinapis]|uniref:Peptidase S1 domain-containing protein n=1 Tax=Leptidea sinapis TaxID=189913 RepID=A0A5E4QPH1_9NEOP|nr:unnamed protein product [Leptidea sinapis]
MMQYWLTVIFLINTDIVCANNSLTNNVKHFNATRRIINGQEAGDTRPYMVYLRPARTETSVDANWLCGGVIVDHQHILTSAACIEDVKHFYVVSGTHKWYEKNTDEECIRNGAKKAVWKCVSKDNIRWMINDIAVVRVEDSFNFEKRVRGCDFIPKQIAYNNQSEEAEKPGTVGSIAGWGSVESFGDVSMNLDYLRPAKSEDNSNYLRSHMNETIHKKFAKRSRHNRQQRQLSEN